MIFELAGRNLWRQPQRTILSSLAIAFTSAFLVFMPSLQNGSYNTMIENTLRMYDGYAEIQAPGYRDNPEIRNSIRDYQALIAQLRSLENVKHISQRAVSFALLANGNRSFGAQITGVQVATEADVSSIPNSIKQGRFLQTGKSDEIVLGERLARNLKLKLGDSVTLLATARDASLAVDALTVVGIFDTGINEMDRLMAEIPLQRFQQTFNMQQQIHGIVLAGKNLPDFQRDIPAIRQLAEKYQLQALDWRQLQPGLFKAIWLDISTALPLYLTMVIVVAFSLLNSILMSVLERSREFGVLLALGMQPADIARMVWLETLLLIMAGLLLGIALGYGISEYYADVGIHFEGAEEIFREYGLPGGMYPQVNGFTLLAGPLIIGLMILLAALIPVRRIMAMEPVEAMRSI